VVKAWQSWLIEYGQSIKEIAERHPGERILIVSHGLALGSIIARTRDLPLEQAYKLIPENADPQIIHWSSHCRKVTE
jgi:broad specificity phosphatase PhoE